MRSDASIPSGGDAAGDGRGLWSMEEAPFNRFHAYMTWCTAGGPLCDGFIFGIIALAFTLLLYVLWQSSCMTSAVAASSLVVMFFGAFVSVWFLGLLRLRMLYYLFVFQY